MLVPTLLCFVVLCTDLLLLQHLVVVVVGEMQGYE